MKLDSPATPAQLSTKYGFRTLCVWLPDFPVQQLCCERPELKTEACVLYAESGNRSQVVIASEEARRYGICSGMPLAEAQALVESAVFLPQDIEAHLQALRSLAALCYLYSPFVGLELSNDSHCLVLDISGCGPLFGDESSLARRLVVDLAERGYFAHIAVANTIGAAWAIARYGHGTGSDRRLRSLPVEALRVPDKLVSRLREFDLRTIGQLAALPKESLPSRFGSALTERLDQIYGRCDELIEPVSLPDPISEEWTTEDPICHPKAIRYVCSNLLESILDTLKSRGEGLLKLSLSFVAEASEPVAVEIGLARPNSSLPHLLTLIDLKIESAAVPEWLHTIRMEASVVASLQVRQRGLFHQDESIDDGSCTQRMIERLTARLGQDAVVRARVMPEAVPEQAVEFTPVTRSTPGDRSTAEPMTALARPLILLPQPEPVSVSTAPDGLLVSFHWNRHRHRVVRCSEVERLATAWWQDSGTVFRDYRQVETSSGARFWLFRERNGEWFLHGLFE
jgi:protein ImuB